MLIEFKIQLDGTGALQVTSPNNNNTSQVAAVSKASAQHELNDVYTARAGAGPVDPISTGGPGPSPSGSGTVFVLGPIVICGSGPGHTGPSGGGPVDGIDTGGPVDGIDTGGPVDGIDTGGPLKKAALQNRRVAQKKIGARRTKKREE